MTDVKVLREAIARVKVLATRAQSIVGDEQGWHVRVLERDLDRILEAASAEADRLDPCPGRKPRETCNAYQRLREALSNSPKEE